MQLVHKTFDEQAEHSVGQSLHMLVSLYILVGHSLIHRLLYNMPVKQLRQVFVVFEHVLHGAVHEMQVWFMYSSYRP